MTYLVAGGSEVDAGKTTFSVGLLEYLDGVGFKPRASNDYWYAHDDYRRAIQAGSMFGKDARRLAAAGTDEFSPEVLNPIHRLWRPAPDGDGFLGPADRQFVLDRVGEGYVVNADADLPDSAREELPLGDAPRVSSIDELNEQIRSRHLPHLRALGRRIEETDRAVVESYSDVARPIRNLDPNRVAVVEPERVRIYDGDRYWRACAVANRSPKEGTMEVFVADVVTSIEPIQTRSLPPLSAEDRSNPETVATAYADAYEALVA